MTDTLDDGAPVLQPETPPSLPEAVQGMELAVTGVYENGKYVIGIKADKGVEFGLTCTHEGLSVVDWLLQAFPPAVEQMIERITEQMEADLGLTDTEEATHG